VSDLGAVLLLIVVAGVGVAGATRTKVTVGSREEGWLGAFTIYSLATLTLAPALLARFGILTRGVVAVSFSAVAVVMVLLLVRRRPSLTGLRLGRIVAVLAVAVVLVAPQLLAIAVRADSVPVSTPWYFWGLAQGYADDGEIPTTVVEYGVETSALTDYAGFSAGTAALSFFSSGPDDIHAAQFMRAIALVGTALGFLLLARAWGASFVSAVGGGAVIMSFAYLSGKLSSYRPEGFGYPLMLIVPAFVVVYLRTRDRSTLIAAAVGTAALSQIHGISFTVCGALVGATFATRIPALWRDRAPEIKAVALGVALIVGAWWAADLVISGRLTQTGKATSVPEISASGIDPTLEFMRAVRTFPEEPFPETGAEVARSVLELGLFVPSQQWGDNVYEAVVVVAVIIVLVGLATRTRGLGTLLGFAAVAVAIIVAICFAFQIGWDTYVPRRTGWYRFLGQALVFVPLLASAALGLARRARWSRVLLVGWLGVAALAYGVTAKPLYDIHDTQPSREALDAARNLDLPPDAVLSTNAYSEGFVTAVLDRIAVTNGRGPYHQAELLDTAIEQLDAARAFYADPVGERDYLRESGVTHLLVSTTPWMFGTTQLYPPHLEALYYHVPGVIPVVEGPEFVLFEVTGADGDPSAEPGAD